MFPGIGSLINGLAVLAVGLLSRLFFKKSIKNFEENLLPLGLLVLALGLRESLKSPDYVRLLNFEVSGFIFTLFAVIIGALIGNYLQIEDKIKKFGDYLYNKFEDSQLDQGKFIDSYISTTLIVITGPLAIIGPFFDVVESNLELLLIKTALDCFLVIFITSSGGKGAVYSGVSILIYQGFFTLCALLINSNIDPIISDSIAGIGGILLIGVGINLLGLRKIPVGNYMLSLFIPFLLAL
ncbi:MAG: DUF554 domain-containing protein [Candidatus Actinomarina sp.]|jgi:uncharacterized membrane protein YqgA involved in biofilm formation|nr:DUF554 domain-containing protein [Candidatus Actinomarina sp.]|tara:strand:+ start:395 stop:1111 length:717 start_codon:yes stop_codon:yes gene_type:complete